MKKVFKFMIVIFSIIVLGIIGILSIIGVRSVIQDFRLIKDDKIAGVNIDRGIISIPLARGKDINTNNTKTYDEILTNALSNGLITSTQKDLILQERTLIQSSIDNINNQQLTKVQRDNSFQILESDIFEWSNKNNIPIRYLGIRGINDRENLGINMNMMQF